MAATQDTHGMPQELYEQALVYEAEAERLKVEAAALRKQADAMMQEVHIPNTRTAKRRQRLSQSGDGRTSVRREKKRTRRGSKPKGIDAVPQEIFDIILDGLLSERDYGRRQTEDLLALRLVSRKIGQMTADHFATEYFTNTEFTISDEQDIQTAISLALHPVYGKAMKNLTLRFDEMETQEKATVYFDKPAAFAANHKLTMHDLDRASAIDKFGRECEAISQRWMMAKEQELDFIHSGRMLQALTYLFSALKHTVKLQELRIRSQGSGTGTRDARGWKLLYKQIYGGLPQEFANFTSAWGLMYRYPDPEHLIGYFGCTLEALIAAELDVPIFNMIGDDIRIEKLARDSAMVQQFGDALRGTREFHFNVSKTYEDVCFDTLPTMDFRPIIDLLTGMPQLTTLHLQGTHSPGTTLFMDALLRQKLPHLKELFLDRMFLFKDMLEDFVDRHPHLDLLATIKCRFYTDSSGRARPELLLKNSLKYVKDYNAESVGRLKRDKVRTRYDYDREWADFTVNEIRPAYLPEDSSAHLW